MSWTRVALPMTLAWPAPAFFRVTAAALKCSNRRAFDMPGAPGFLRERDLFVNLFGTADQREGMRAFIEKREPRFKGR